MKLSSPVLHNDFKLLFIGYLAPLKVVYKWEQARIKYTSNLIKLLQFQLLLLIEIVRCFSRTKTFRKEPMQQLIIHLLHSLEVVLFVIGTTFVTKTFLFDISFPYSRCSLLSITTTHCWKVTTRGSWKPANNSCMETWMKTWFENFCHLGNYIELLLL